MRSEHAATTREANLGINLNQKARMRRIPTMTLLAWLFWIAVMVSATASFTLRIQINSLLVRREHIVGSEYLQQMLYYVILISALAPTYGTVGAIIASRRPGNGVGWLCLTFGFFLSVQDITWEYATRALEVAPGSLPAGPLMAWLSQALLLTFPLPSPLPPLPLLGLLLLLLFPDGHFLSRRWRLVGWATLGWTFLSTLVLLISPTLPVGIHLQIPNPTAIMAMQPALAGVKTFIAWAGLVVGSAALISIFVRWKRARDNERQQLKWLVYVGAVIIAAGLLALATSYLPVSAYTPVLIGAIGVAGITIGIPVAIGIAILKHRLYDIDLLINRTLVYGLLTGSLALVYFGSVFVLQFIFRALFEQTNAVAIVGSTVVIVALFQPLRWRIQQAIDRRFYRRKYDAARTLAAFAATLRNEVDLNRLSERLEAVVQETMQPRHISLWLRPQSWEERKTTLPLPHLDEERSTR